MKSMPRVMASRYLLLLKIKNVYPQSICPVFRVSLRIANRDENFTGRQLETAASHYETQLRPPFFRALVDYVNQGNSAFDCPGHQGGEFFRRHPAGNQFVEYFGEALFRADLCNTGLSGNGT